MTEGASSSRDEIGGGWVRRWLGIVLLAVSLVGVVWASERTMSPTTDEPGHMVRGLAFWWAPDTRMSWPHPPLGQALAVLPIVILDEPVAPFETLGGWENASFGGVTVRYFEADWARARAQLTMARRAMAVMAALTSIYLFWWTRRRVDEKTAWMVTWFFVANPITLANAGLITTDFPVAAATLFALTQVHDFVFVSRRHIVGLALAAAALATTKLSGLVVLAILAVPVVAVALRGRGRFRGVPLRHRVRSIVIDGVAIALVMLVGIAAVYRFHDMFLTPSEVIAHVEPNNWIGKDHLSEDDVGLVALPEVPLPLPWAYIYSAEFIRTHADLGHKSWFMGEVAKTGWPGYFVILLAIKQPAVTVITLVIGAAYGVARLLGRARRWIARRRAGTESEHSDEEAPRKDHAVTATALIAYFAIAYLVATFNAKINIGVRHAIPAVPALTWLAGRSAVVVVDTVSRWLKLSARTVQVGLAVCCFSALMSVVHAYPWFLSDFNVFVGGRKGGHEISLVGEDWGQDVGLLAHEVSRNQWLPLSYYTKDPYRPHEMRSYGVTPTIVKCEDPVDPSTYLAIHRSRLVRDVLKSCFHATDGRHEIAMVNDHIVIFAPVGAK